MAFGARSCSGGSAVARCHSSAQLLAAVLPAILAVVYAIKPVLAFMLASSSLRAIHKFLKAKSILIYAKLFVNLR